MDAGYIAGHLGLDEPVITSLTTAPTVELVTQLLEAVAAKAHEFDTLYAEKLQTDIELENVVRSSESLSQASKATAENALKELEETRQKLKEEGESLFLVAALFVRNFVFANGPPHTQRTSAKPSKMSCKHSRPKTLATTTSSRP